MTQFMPFFFLLFSISHAKAVQVSDFEGEYFYRHSLYMQPEEQTVHGVEDVVKIQPVDDKKANILIETYSQNFHSCQLVGEAELQGEQLIFKSSINKRLNRGKTANCTIKISQTRTPAGDKSVKVEDEEDNCHLKYCGMTAELGGQFSIRSPTPVTTQDKN